MRCAAILFLWSAGLAAQSASLEGVAINAQTGEPLSGVHVRLFSYTKDGATGSYGALSDRDGRISIALIRPGAYMLIAERSGYLHLQSKDAGLPSVTVKAGQQVKDFKIAMTPRAILSGRVVDENGEPVQDVQLEPVAAEPTAVPSMLMPRSDAATDDHGEFRIVAPPGRYYLRATPEGARNPPAEYTSDGSLAPPFRATFYPSPVSKERAQTVQAVAGKETGGLEIHLTRQRAASITGIVSGIPEQDARAAVSLRLSEGARRGRIRNVNTTPDGRFVFPGLEPGRYLIAASFKNGKAAFASRAVAVRLEDSDPPPMALALEPAGDVSGTLVIEGDPPGVPAAKLVVRLQPADSNWYNSGGMTGGDLDRDGAFRIEGVGPGAYRVRVDGLPEDAYVKAVESGGARSPDGEIEIAGGAQMKITVSRAGARISGRVLDSAGDRLMTNLAAVILMNGPAGQVNIPGDLKPDGTYSLGGIPPGKYRIAAVDMFSMVGLADEEGFKKIYERGEEIELKPGDRVRKDVRTIPKEDTGAKPKQ